ncbi:MAG: TetR/AcrR family transcriptional regulator [Cypionkella sp.]
MTIALSTQDQRTEQRTADILSAVRFAFAEKGFDGASMQDLARAAGMSVGNFYRYFPSKSAIVDQLIASDLADVEHDFAEILKSASPFAGLRKQLHQRIVGPNSCVDGQIWAEITSAARRKPEIGQATKLMETTISKYLLQVFVLETGLPLAEVTLRFSSHAAFIMLLVKSSLMLPETEASALHALNILILKTIDQTLAEIASASVKV